MALEKLASDIVRKDREGKDINFKKISIRERVSILKKLKNEKRQLLVDALKQASTDSKSFLNELDAFDNLYFTDWYFIKYVNSPYGQVEVVLKSLSKYPNPEEVLDSIELNPDQLLELAAEVCGLELLDKNATDEKKTPVKIETSEKGS